MLYKSYGDESAKEVFQEECTKLREKYEEPDSDHPTLNFIGPGPLRIGVVSTLMSRVAQCL